MNRTRYTVLCWCVVLFTLALAGNVSSQSNESDNVKTSIAKVQTFLSPFAVIPYAGASLSRNNDSVFGTISTSGLPQGEVVTLWWAIFYNPEFCSTPGCLAMDLNNPAVNGSLQFGGGQVVGPNGRADFGGYLAVGDNTGFHFLSPSMPNPAPGVVNPKGATIHLVIRKHGPASEDPTILNQQLSSFGGGCSVNPCANIQAALFPQ
jgi:hypothetical protein